MKTEIENIIQRNQEIIDEINEMRQEGEEEYFEEETWILREIQEHHEEIIEMYKRLSEEKNENKE